MGKTVTRWNSAKLASGISAPTRSTPAWFRISGMIGEGSSRRSFKQASELVRRDKPQPREQGDDVDREGAEEGIAPAPIQEVGFRQVEQEECEQDAGDHEPEWRSELRDGGIEAAALDRRVEREKGGKPVPGATERKTLPNA